jgi:ribosomal protein L11 methyltransferase
MDKVIRQLQQVSLFKQGVQYKLEQLEDKDWEREWMDNFHPIRFGQRLWVCPSWRDIPDPTAVNVMLDPGLAFGTGTHPTTRMCLRWTAAHAPQGQRVLDYGCGSGILAMGAAKFGATDIDAVDIDPAAVEATTLNAETNHVRLRPGLPELAQGEYDLVLANILATPLKVLAPLLCAHVRSGGRLVLAGILSRQAQELKDAYAPWIALDVSDEQEGWILMTGQKP